jgi:hypothetical protein
MVSLPVFLFWVGAHVWPVFDCDTVCLFVLACQPLFSPVFLFTLLACFGISVCLLACLLHCWPACRLLTCQFDVVMSDSLLACLSAAPCLCDVGLSASLLAFLSAVLPVWCCPVCFFVVLPVLMSACLLHSWLSCLLVCWPVCLFTVNPCSTGWFSNVLSSWFCPFKCTTSVQNDCFCFLREAFANCLDRRTHL